MTDRYLTTVFEEAENVAEQHDQVARTTDNLRYAVLGSVYVLRLQPQFRARQQAVIDRLQTFLGQLSDGP